MPLRKPIIVSFAPIASFILVALIAALLGPASFLSLSPLNNLWTNSDMASASSSLLKTIVVPAASGKATASVIFCHGLGDTGAGWADVAQLLSARPALRHVRYILPNAPIQPVTVNMGMSMPSWFDITSLDDVAEAEDEKGLLKSAADVMRLVNAEVEGTAEGLKGTKIPSNRVVLGGFSQGGAISYLAGLTSSTPLAGIVALSTWLPLHSKLLSLLHPSNVHKSIPIFHGHGDADPIVRYEFGKRSVEKLTSDSEGNFGLGEFRGQAGKWKGVRFETYRGMPHSACNEEIQHIGQFLEKIIPAE